MRLDAGFVRVCHCLAVSTHGPSRGIRSSLTILCKPSTDQRINCYSGLLYDRIDNTAHQFAGS
jgi:hypothetical protein